MNGEQRFRVYNKCPFDIGVTLTTGQQPVIKPRSFLLLSVNDIMYIESICNVRKLFSSKMLVAVDDSGKELTLEELGGFTDEMEEVHMDEDEITAMLKKPVKQFEAWIMHIEDPVELHNVFMIAKNMDLPSSKLKILNKKMPNKEWLDNDE